MSNKTYKKKSYSELTEEQKERARSYVRAWRNNHPERAKEMAARWRLANPDAYKRSAEDSVLRRAATIAIKRLEAKEALPSEFIGAVSDVHDVYFG